MNKNKVTKKEFKEKTDLINLTKEFNMKATIFYTIMMSGHHYFAYDNIYKTYRPINKIEAMFLYKKNNFKLKEAKNPVLKWLPNL